MDWSGLHVQSGVGAGTRCLLWAASPGSLACGPAVSEDGLAAFRAVISHLTVGGHQNTPAHLERIARSQEPGGTRVGFLF